MTKFSCKFISAFFMSASAAAIISTGIFAATPSLSVQPSSATVKPGDTFTVNVNISDNPGISGYDIILSYDSINLEYVGNNSGSVSLGYSVANTNYSDGKIKLSAASASDVSGNGSLLTLSFKAKTTSNGKNASISASAETLFNSSMTDISASTGSATVKIQSASGSETNTEATTQTTSKSEQSTQAATQSQQTTKSASEQTTSKQAENPTEATTSSAGYIKGDVNNDKLVNRGDYVLAAKFFAGNNVSVNTAALDVDDNGSVTRADYMKISRYFAGKIDSL